MSEEVKQEGEVQANKPETQRFPTQEEIKRMRKQAAMDLADYKKRLRESVELKRLQVEEIELNIRFYHVRQEHKKVAVLIQEEEAKEQAEMEKAKKENELKKAKKIEVVKVGKARTEDEIKQAKEEV